MPGGDLHRVKIAFLYGADAVYIGLDKYSLRKAKVRFTIPEIKKAIEYAHKIGKKLYVTFNIFAHDKHLKTIEKDMKEIAAAKPDAFIIADPGIVLISKKVAPGIPIHLSTQANTVNSASVKFWQAQGIKRVVLGREATLEEIKVIKKSVPTMELEVFVHGAMCISYSGRCLMSAALTGRSANLGECTQPCRWNYNLYLEEKQRPGEYMALTEDENGSYVMNSKDLCLIEYLDKIAPYVDAFKVEGRNKTDYYVATVANSYRSALDMLCKNEYTSKNIKKMKAELDALTHRGYTSGFIFSDAKKGETFPTREPILGKKYLGYIKNAKNHKGLAIVKNKLETGKKYELLSPQGTKTFTILEIIDGDTKISSVNPGETNKSVEIVCDIDLYESSFIRSC